MEKKYITIHLIVEACLALICIFIGYFEDAFILSAFVIACIYNLTYILLLRKKTGEHLLSALSNIVLLWVSIINLIYVIYALYIFIGGYTDYGFLGMGEGRTYFGLDAWKNNLAVILFAPAALINFLYIGGYVFFKKRKTKKM